VYFKGRNFRVFANFQQNREILISRKISIPINSQQNEVQSAYFGQQNFSIFTSCSYYRDSGEDNLTKVPMAVISESNDHSRIAAFSCIVAIIEELKK